MIQYFRYSLLPILIVQGLFYAKSQPRYRLITKDTIHGIHLAHPRIFDLTASGLGSRYAKGGYIVGTDKSLQNFQILQLFFQKKGVEIIENYVTIPIPKEILEFKMGNKIIIASLCEPKNGTLTFLVNRRFWVTINLIAKKAKIKSIVDVYKKTGYGFRNIIGYGKTIVAFKELNLASICPDNNLPDTAKLFIFDREFNFINKIPIPDFETSFLDFGNYRYLDYKDGKLVILSPTRFILTTFDFKSRKVNRLQISELGNFKYSLLDTGYENRIKRDFPGNRSSDRSNKIFQIVDRFTYVTKMYINTKNEIRFICETVSPDHIEYSLSNLKMNKDSLSYSIIDNDLNMNNKFKDGEIISKTDFLFAPTNINFSKSGTIFFVFGPDNWNINLIGLTYKEFQKQAFASRNEFKLRYYFLEEFID